MKNKFIYKFLKKAIPLWLAIFIVFDSTGYTTSLKWKNLGQQLVESGVIDKKKYEELFAGEADGKSELKYLDGDWNENITINEKNSRFIVNTFWALGLVNKSRVLDEDPMVQGGREKTGNFALTGGWTIRAKPVMELYSSKEIIPLTLEQQNLVKTIAENVFRPCCNNPTSFPDCNHGMAAYFDKQGTKWKDVDTKLTLSQDYSSAQGAKRIKQAVQGIPGIQNSGGSCEV